MMRKRRVPPFPLIIFFIYVLKMLHQHNCYFLKDVVFSTFSSLFHSFFLTVPS